MRDRGGFRRERNVRRIGLAAKPRKQRAGVAQRQARTALAQILGDAGGQAVEIDDADRGIFSALPRSVAPPSSPMRGVWNTSAMRLVRSIQVLTRKVSAATRNGSPLARQNQQRLRPVRHEAGEPGHAGRPRDVGVDDERIELRLAHRRAHAIEPRSSTASGNSSGEREIRPRRIFALVASRRHFE